MKTFYNKLFKSTLSTALTVVIAIVLCAGVVWGATTISSDISTGGDLAVTGLSTFGRATSTSATTTSYLYVGVDVSVPTGFDFSGDLVVSDDVYINDRATSSNSLWIGDGGTANYIDVDEDLYVEDDVEVDGGIWMNSGTTTDTFVIGGNATTTGKAVFGSSAPGAAATTTLTFGSYAGGDTKGLCLKFFSGGATIYCHFNTAITAATGTALICTTTSCE